MAFPTVFDPIAPFYIIYITSKSHEFPWKTTICLWFSYGFPMVPTDARGLRRSGRRFAALLRGAAVARRRRRPATAALGREPLGLVWTAAGRADGGGGVLQKSWENLWENGKIHGKM